MTYKILCRMGICSHCFSFSPVTPPCVCVYMPNTTTVIVSMAHFGIIAITKGVTSRISSVRIWELRISVATLKKPRIVF